MTAFEARCKPRVAGPELQPSDYMTQALYVWYPGNHMVTLFKIMAELNIVYKTMRDRNTNPT